MPYRPLERQYRNMAQPLAVTKRAGYEKRFESDFYVEGYASTFDDPYVLFKDPWDGTEYKEIVRADAFSDAVMDDVIMQFDHRGRVYARMSNRTLVVEPDKHGLFTAADLKSTETSRSLYEDIDAGLITRMSWAFTIEDQEFDRAEHTYIIKKTRTRTFRLGTCSTERSSGRTRSLSAHAIANAQRLVRWQQSPQALTERRFSNGRAYQHERGRDHRGASAAHGRGR